MSKIKYVLSYVFLLTTSAFAQNPREIRLDNDPFDFTDPIKLIVVFIIPILLIIIWVLIVRKRKKRRNI